VAAGTQLGHQAQLPIVWSYEVFEQSLGLMQSMSVLTKQRWLLLAASSTIALTAIAGTDPDPGVTDVLGHSCLQSDLRSIRAIRAVPDMTAVVHVLLKGTHRGEPKFAEVSRELVEELHLKPGMRLCKVVESLD
jgi:hypothetical protein